MSNVPRQGSDRTAVDLTGVTVSHFRVLEPIGRGGMGIVYRAEDTTLRRVVALKVLPPEHVMDEERRARFFREARAAAALTHPNIAVVHEVGEADGAVFIAMELVVGASLRDRLADGALAVDRAANIALGIARALARAHAAGIVHRDLKPENVMVGDDDGVKLLDFGIAKAFDRRDEHDRPLALLSTASALHTDEGRIIGTPLYMSPEQLGGEIVDSRSDVFSFGVVLHEMLTGVSPFARPSLVDVAIAIRRDDPPPLPERVPPALAQLVMDCLAKKAEARPRDGQALVVRLRDATGVASSASGSAPRPAPEVRRRWPRWPAIAAGALALSAGAWALAAWRHEKPKPTTTTTAASASAAVAVSARPLLFDPSHTLERDVAAELLQVANSNLTISPDGTRFGCVGRRGPIVQRLDGGPVPIVPPDPASFETVYGAPSFFPDGEHLLVAWYKKGAPDVVLWEQTASGADAKLRGTAAGAPIMSPDAKHVAIASEHGIAVGGLGEVPTTTFDGVAFWNLAWAPASDAIATATEDRACTIRLLALDHTRGATIAAPEGETLCNGVGNIAVAWPEEDRLLFGASRGRDGLLYEVTLDDRLQPVGAPRLLWRWPGAALDVIAYAHGVLVFRKLVTDADVYVGVLSRDGRTLTTPLAQLTSNRASDYPRGFLPDGRALYASDREGDVALFTESAAAAPRRWHDDLQGARALANGDVIGWRNVKAKPGAAACALVRVGASGEGEQVLFEAPRAEEPSDGVTIRCGSKIACPATGSCIAEEDGANGMTTLVSFSLERGTRGEVRGGSRVPLQAWALSPNGDQLAWASPGVLTVATESATKTATIPEAALVQAMAFSPDGARLVATGMNLLQKRYAMVALDFDGTMRELWSSEDKWIATPYVSPSGWIAVQQKRMEPSMGALVPR